MKTYTYMIVLILVFLFFRCDSKTREISMELENMITNSKNDTIYFRFSDFIDSNYDKVLILPPYTRIHRVEKDLEISMEKVKKTGIEQRDDVCVLCIFKNKILKEYKILNRSPIDWSNINDFKFIEKDTEFRIIKHQEKYHIEKTQDGEWWKIEY